jgi:septum site-determining protein MinD
MGQVISAVSGKGGTGKTSLVGGVGSCLAALGKRVLCVDLDCGLRNLDITLGMTPLFDFCDVLSGCSTLERAAMQHPDIPGLYLLTAPMNIGADSVDTGGFEELMRDARLRFDYILLDAPAGIGSGFELAVGCADRVIVVAMADASSRRGACATALRLRRLGDPPASLVLNRVSRRLLEQMGVLIDDVIDETGLQLLGVVPEDLNVIRSASAGSALMLFRRREALKAYANIARRLAGQRVPLLRFRGRGSVSEQRRANTGPRHAK